MVQIVFFGVTGFIGGAVLDALLCEFHEEVKVQALVRTQDQAARLTAQYPTVSCIIGRTEDLDVVEQLSRDANIVINCAPDITHEADIQAMLKGLSSRAPGNKGYYIHTAGEGEPTGEFGGRLWDDLTNIEEINALPSSHTHAKTNKIVRDASAAVHVAIMSPGGVSGLSPSLEHPTPLIASIWGGAIRVYGGTFQVGPGESRNATIHVLDLAEQYLVLVRNALSELTGRPDENSAPPFPLWGPRAFYFGCTENVAYGEWLQLLAEAMKAHGLVQHTDRRTITVSDAARLSLASQMGGEYDPDAPLPPADSWVMHLASSYGLNMRVKPTRMERLGWKPKHGVAEDLAEVIAKCVELGKL
ncbi:hypothetical protein N0V82_005137 [Gnomoniopsis sp. IMI 355080]|nr:hypothetical protein N0V82_005137 [Gnomoniopsis sp. IMI 355080]